MGGSFNDRTEDFESSDVGLIPAPPTNLKYVRLHRGEKATSRTTLW